MVLSSHQTPGSRYGKIGGFSVALSMIEVAAVELKQAVERMHNCSARLVQSVPIREQFERKTVWDGIMHVFALTGHPAATRAYAW